MLSEPAAFSDDATVGIASLDDARRRRRAKVAGLLTIAAAAVAAGVLVAGNLGALTSAPEPASTVDSHRKRRSDTDSFRQCGGNPHRKRTGSADH